MRDYLLLYINGREHRVSGADAFQPLSTYLRYGQSATGTKVVCEEGDCGACTIILGKVTGDELTYRPVNSCIQFLYQLDATHVVTVEGLKYEGELNPVQQAMVDCHGAQCGFCTPGFITAMCSMYEQCTPTSVQDVKDALTGNLCRCTGYESIIKAGLTADSTKMLKLGELYPSQEMLLALRKAAVEAVLIDTATRKFYKPIDVKSAVEFRKDNPGTVPVAGGTDVCVYWNKRGIEPRSLMSTTSIAGMNILELNGDAITVGGNTNLSQLETFCKQHVPEFERMLWLFGSPQIRHAGTLAGNIANGSPIADSLPFLCVMEAQLELTGTTGTRMVNINKFYKGYKQLDLADDELITRIVIPLPKPAEHVKLYKVSRRRHLDISTFSAAFKIEVAADNSVKAVSIAYGGVGPTVMRLHKTEAFLAGKPVSLETFQSAGEVALKEVTPISDVRGAADYRNRLASNILQKFYFELSELRETGRRPLVHT